jgi:hypothetical protein
MGADPTAVISMIRAFAAALATRRRERVARGEPPAPPDEATLDALLAAERVQRGLALDSNGVTPIGGAEGT